MKIGTVVSLPNEDLKVQTCSNAHLMFSFYTTLSLAMTAWQDSFTCICETPPWLLGSDSSGCLASRRHRQIEIASWTRYRVFREETRIDSPHVTLGALNTLHRAMREVLIFFFFSPRNTVTKNRDQRIKMRFLNADGRWGEKNKN